MQKIPKFNLEKEFSHETFIENEEFKLANFLVSKVDVVTEGENLRK